MTRFIPLAIASLALASPAGLAEDKDKDQDKASGRDVARKDLEKLQGTWVLVAMETEGQVLLPEGLKEYHAVYEGDAVTLMRGEKVRRRGIVTLDPAHSPKAINTWDLDGPHADETTPGIYELEGDTLRLCFARAGESRPTEFTTMKGTGFLCVSYERQRRKP